MSVPPPTRLYWICQAAGWGSFVFYTLLLYVFVFEVESWEVVASIVVIDGGVCPWLTHALRGWMYRRGWLRRSLRSLLPRAAGAAVLLAAAVAVLVVVVARLIPDNEPIDSTGAFWMFVTFLWAFSGWLLIYFAVHARRQRDARELELTLDARNAQLDLLRAQVNPHFLFNCLNSVRAMIIENPERASSMVTSLSDLLRYSLQSEHKHTVSLAEELAIVDEYVLLERVRFEDRLRFERLLDPGALESRVPPMLVQTLVENAVKHGIADLPEGGVVRLRAAITGRRMTIVLFEVEGNHARAYFGGNRPLIRASLNALENRLDPSLFFRASRRHIVNLRFIESVETSPDDSYIIHLKNKSEVPVSRRQSRQLRESLGL